MTYVKNFSARVTFSGGLALYSDDLLACCNPSISYLHSYNLDDIISDSQHQPLCRHETISKLPPFRRKIVQMGKVRPSQFILGEMAGKRNTCHQAQRQRAVFLRIL